MGPISKIRRVIYIWFCFQIFPVNFILLSNIDAKFFKTSIADFEVNSSTRDPIRFNTFNKVLIGIRWVKLDILRLFINRAVDGLKLFNTVLHTICFSCSRSSIENYIYIIKICKLSRIIAVVTHVP